MTKTPDEMAEEELNKDMAKGMAKRLKEIKKKKAEIKRLEKEIEKIKSGELVPDGEGSSLSSDKKHVVILLDESGSMSLCRDSVISGYNEYITKLKNSSTNINVTLTKFDSTGIREVYKDKYIQDIGTLTQNDYVPGEMTPLYDAIGKTITSIKDLKNVLFIIYTDGQENCSREYTHDSVKKLIDEHRKNSWGFVYLGINIDAWNQGGKSLGYISGATFSGGYQETSACFYGMSDFTIGYSKGVLTSEQFAGTMLDSLDKQKKKKTTDIQS